MMKGRLSSIILIVVIVIVWGFLAVKIYGALHHPTIYVSPTQTKINAISNETKARDSLVLNYNDPFLNESFIPKKISFTVQTKKPTTPILKVSPTNSVPLSIQFLGRANSSKGSQVGVFRVESQEVLIQKGESFNEIRVITIWNDSAKVMINQKARILRL